MEFVIYFGHYEVYMGNFNYLVTRSIDYKVAKPRIDKNASVLFPIMLIDYNVPVKYHESKVKSVSDYYFMLEIEKSKSDKPHFHLYEIGPNGRIAENARKSIGISLETGINKGLVCIDTGNKKKYKVLDSEVENLVILFVEENRKLLLYMYEALKLGRVKNFHGMSDAYEQKLETKFTRNELASINRKYEKLCGEISPVQFGE